MAGPPERGVIVNARDAILARLRAVPAPFDSVTAPDEAVIVADAAPHALRETFIARAQALAAIVFEAPDDAAACAHIVGLLGDDRSVMAWDYAAIGLPRLDAALAEAGIVPTHPRDASARCGITGVDAALAATGSIVVSAASGRPRTASLLPDVHIAVVRETQMLPHLEAWAALQAADLAAFRRAGNHIIISGASRTADIGMELVMGAHGPARLHLVLI
jgi:L-lactate dehydrogenase complex protein LldG